MKLSELIEQLQSVESEYGNFHVGATCDGWLPPEVAIEVQPDREVVVLNGCRDVDDHAKWNGYDGNTVVNADIEE